MKRGVFFSLEAARRNFGPCALAIGNFDGVHLGHQALLAGMRRYASNSRLPPAVLTFYPHPAVFVAPHRVPEMLCSLDERLRLLRAAGAERILVLPFDQALSRLSPEHFVSEVLSKVLEARAIFVGDNFRFGYQQAGTTHTLRSLGERFDFIPYFLRPVRYRGRLVSSSLVRESLAANKVSFANHLLGRCFGIEGPVVPGHGIGSKQTVPTLNLRPRDGQVTPRGVYITETLELSTGRRWPSITNSGFRPTFEGRDLTIETFLLGPLEGSAPENIRIHFRRFLRAEQTFPDPEALKAQIFKDVGRANRYWRRVSKLAQLPSSIY
jgi:riboflavin kinase/FMN adenylyltransferase